jgi:uncharacterized protein YndB with AHSA1/START domain
MIRKAIAIIGAVVASALIGVMIAAMFLPTAFRIERTIMIKAPPEAIFPLLTDLRAWQGWSPWEGKDPALKRTYSGPDSGVGGAYAWEGNDAVGAGRMEITDVTVPSRMAMRLDFLRPFEAHNQVLFTLTPTEGGARGATTVSWVMTGENPFLAKVVQVFVSIDAMVGPDFEAGLANLRRAAEK